MSYDDVLKQPDKLPEQFVSWLRRFIMDNTLVSISQGQVDVTTPGSSTYKKVSANSTNATSVKATAGVVTGYFISNQNAATRYLKLYDKASAPTVGSDTILATFAIPGGASANVGFNSALIFLVGIAFALTTGDSDANTGAVAADDLIVNLFYR